VHLFADFYWVLHGLSWTRSGGRGQWREKSAIR